MNAQDCVERLLQRLDALAPAIAACTRDADAAARMPAPVARGLIEGGLLRLWIPCSCGGFELTLPQALRIYEAAARLDGSVGWAVMIGAGGGLFGAYLEPESAREVFARTDAVIAGSGAPGGRAERVAGGYRASGRWRYASGAHYATSFTANCVITQGGVPVRDARGDPLIRAMTFDPAQVRIVDAWNPSGMRGTGSHDFEVTGAFVPERRTFSVFTDAPREPGVLYRLPFEVLTELPVTAVGLGIARHALDAFGALAQRKRIEGSDAPLADDPGMRGEYARSHATWRIAQSAVATLAHRAWGVAESGRTLDSAERGEITAVCAQCMVQLRTAVGELAALAGMSALERTGEFARAWRDLQALAAHVSVVPRHFTAAGAQLLGGGEPWTSPPAAAEPGPTAGPGR